MMKPKHRALVAVLAIPVVLLIGRILFVPRSSNPESEQPSRLSVTASSLTKTAQAWAAREFESVKSKDQIIRQLDAIPIKNSEALDSDQKARLQMALGDFFFAYTSGQFEDYRKFRRRSSASAIVSKDVLLSRIESASGPLLNQWKSREVDDIERKTWEVFTSGGPAWFSVSFASAVCEVEITNKVVLYQNYSPASLLLPEGGVVATAQIPSSYTIEPSPESVLASAKNFTTARVSCLARVAQTHPPILYHCRFYWNPVAQDWTPWTLERSFVGDDPQTVLF